MSRNFYFLKVIAKIFFPYSQLFFVPVDQGKYIQGPGYHSSAILLVAAQGRDTPLVRLFPIHTLQNLSKCSNITCYGIKMKEKFMDKKYHRKIYGNKFMEKNTIEKFMEKNLWKKIPSTFSKTWENTQTLQVLASNVLQKLEIMKIR